MLTSRTASTDDAPAHAVSAAAAADIGTAGSDQDLLQRFISRNDEAAFRTLVERHTQLVYAAARRQLRSSADAHLADDVTQAVFVLLATKATSVGDGRTLPGWLVTTARLSARAALRNESRRRARERRSVELHQKSETSMPAASPADVYAIEEYVDEALCKLGGVDRTAVTLCYLQGRSHREVAAALGVSEDAASRRISRAMAKLRSWFAARGMMFTPMALGDTMLKQLVRAGPHAPPSLASATSDVALSAARTGVPGATVPPAVVAIVQSLRWRHAAGRVAALFVAAVVVILAIVGGASFGARHADNARPGALAIAAATGPVKVGWYISAATAAPKPSEENAWFKMFRVADEVRSEPNLDIVPLIEPGSADQPQQRRLIEMYFPGKTPLDVTDVNVLRKLDVIVGGEIHNAPDIALHAIATAVENGTGLVTRSCLGGCRPGPAEPFVARMRGLKTLQSGTGPGPVDCIVVADHPLLGTLVANASAPLKLYPVGGYGSIQDGVNGASLIRMKTTDGIRNSQGRVVETPSPPTDGHVLFVSGAGKGRIVGVNIAGNTPEVLQQATGNRFTARTILWAAHRPLD